MKKDAFDMSPEEFQAALTDVGSGEEIDTGEDVDEQAPAEQEDAGEKQEPKATTDRFSLDDEEGDKEPAEEAAQEGDEQTDEQQEFVEIIHNGEKKQITREQMVKLAQKGFDYETKTAQIAPYRKIGELLQADPELARQVNDIIQQKVSGQARQPATQPKAEPPKLKPLEDYDNEADWFRDNYEALSKQQKPPEPQRQPQQKENPFIQHLQYTDLEAFPKVAAAAQKYIPHLTVADQQRVDTDPSAFRKFYSFVREREGFGPLPDTVAPTRQPAAQPATQAEPRKQPQFRMKPGGGNPPREPKDKNAWDLGNDEFNQLLNKVKGY